MSVPHTGKLVAIVRGLRCEFDGNTWQTPDPDLTAELTDARASSPVTHFSIDELAGHIFYKLGLTASARIVSVEHDAWQTEIPGDAID